MHQSITMQTKRKEWIDVLRGIAMLLVIYGHLLSGYGHTCYYVVTSPIKIPLFFAITGYVFNCRDGNVRQFFSNLFMTLVIPLLFFTIILLPFKLFAAYRGLVNHTVKEVLFSFIIGNEFWYLPCCIVAEIIFFFVLKLNKDEIWIVATGVLLSTIGFVLAELNILSLANINTAFSAQLFILIGYCFRNHEQWFEQYRKAVIPIGLIIYAILIIISIVFFPGKSIDIHRNLYYCLPVNIVSIIVGNILLFTIAKALDIKLKPISYVGRNTIVYYVLHEYFIGAIGVALILLHIKESGTYLFEFIILLLTCALCGFAAVIISKYVPFAVGKKRTAN